MMRLIATAGIVGALIPVAATTAAQAAPAAAPACVTASETYNWGTGEISLCPQSDGTYHVTGWTDDLLPGDWTPDGACVYWSITLDGGGHSSTGLNCAQFHPERPTKLPFDYVTTYAAPVVSAKLGKAFV